MVLQLFDLFLWLLLVLITLYRIVDIAHRRSLRLLGNSQEVLLLLFLPACTRLLCGLARVEYELFSVDFFGCSEEPSIWSSGFSGFGTSFPTLLYHLLILLVFHSVKNDLNLHMWYLCGSWNCLSLTGHKWYIAIHRIRDGNLIIPADSWHFSLILLSMSATC